jgi:hypothetical protein
MNKRWINTKVEFEWDGIQYIEIYTEGYWYEGELALAGPPNLPPANVTVATGPSNGEIVVTIVTGQEETGDWYDIRIDRKSTRLNSSH